MTPLTDGHTPILMPTQNTKTVTATAAAITKPSLSLIDGNVVERVAHEADVASDSCGSRRVARRVADTVHGAHDVVAELAAQGAHVRVDGARAGAVVVAPDLARAAARG